MSETEKQQDTQMEEKNDKTELDEKVS